MNKLFRKIIGVALGLTMAIGVGVAVASGSKEASPVHATSAEIVSATYDFEDDSAHRTSGNNSYTGSNTYTEHSTGDINLTYADSATTGKPISGSAHVIGRIAKNKTTCPVVIVGPVDLSSYNVMGISYYAKGPNTLTFTSSYSTNNSTWTQLETHDSTTTATTYGNETNLASTISKPSSLYFKIAISIKNGNSTTSNRDVNIDDIKFYGEEVPTGFDVSYNKNLPTGASESDLANWPSNVKGQSSYTIPSTKPSLPGYKFDGYAISQSAAASKQPGDSITATTTLWGKWTAKTALTLTAANVNMKLGDSNESVTVTAGGSTVTGYTLASGNTNVISIVNNQLHVVGLGDATITITKAEDANNTYTSGTFNVHVDYADITSFVLDYTEGTLGKGGEATLPGVTILPANANQGYSWGDAVATEGIVYTYNSSTHELAIDANNTVEGTIQFTATATGDSSKTATVVYTVQAAQIANITGVTASATGAIVAKQYVGNAFNPQGFSFAPTWSEGDHEVVEITANDISWNALVAGSNPTGTYSCADGEFTVTITDVTVVNDTLVSIAFAEGCDMTKKSYNVGDSWDFSGLSIVGTMDSGKTAPAIASSNVTFSSNDAVATDTTSITVTAEYNNLTATKEISGIVVNEVTMDSLTVNYTGGQPVLGTDFTFAGSITANMSNGTHPTVNLSDVTIGSVDKFTLNQQTITVTHKETKATGTFNVTYKTKAITYTTSWDKASTIAVGDTIALAHIDKGQVMTGVTNNIGTNGSATISNNKLTPASGVTIYELEVVTGNSTGSIALKHGNDYLSYSGSSNNISTSTTLNNNSSWTVTWSGGRPTITNVASNTRKIVYNTGSPRFCCYTSAQGGLDVFTKTQTASGTADIIKLNAALKSGKTFNEGATISASDFDCSTLDNLNQTKTVTATSVSPTNLVAGENTITVYYNTWSTTVTVNAAEVAHLDHIEVVDGTGTRSFARESAFNSTGLKIKAYYSNTDKTKFPDRELTSGFTVTPLTSAQMNVADTYDVSVSYTENGVTKNTTYNVTVTPKVSTSVTIAGDGIEGSNGAYTLASGVTNEVELTLGCNGDETVEFVQGDQNVVTFANGKLSVNSSTKTNEQITVSFKAGSAIATLTVNISAAEGIQLLSDEEIDGYVGSSFSYDINIKLDNVESATWTLPQGNFVIESETEDNTGFVGTIYFTAEIDDTLTFSALTGKGETLTVDIAVFAITDEIKSISASLKSGVTYSAGKGQTFSNDNLTVTFERDSGARGTLASNEFTVSGQPEGSFNRVTSYDLTITSVENANATSALTINVGMPSDLNLNFVTSAQVTEDGETYWKKVTDLSTISTSKKYAFIIEDGANSKIFNGVDDATADNAETPVGYINTSVSDGKATYTEGSPYLTINYNSSEETASIKCVGGSETLAGKYIYGKSGSNTITNGATETFMSFTLDDDNHIIAESNSTSFRFNATSNQNRFRFYKIATTGNSYLYPCLYELATKPGDSHLEYSNVNETTDTTNKYDFAKLYNFIALANETYADICGSEGNNQKPDLTTWRSVLESDEYEALVADTNSYNLLKSAICGEGAYGLDGVYVASGEKQSSDMVIEFLQKYDRVVSNYSSENYNYLGRNVASPSARINPILALNEVDNSVWVISAVALVGLTAIGGYFFYRKRKEI